MAASDDSVSTPPPSCLRRRLVKRIVGLALLALALQIPTSIIRGIVRDLRDSHRRGVALARKRWGCPPDGSEFLLICDEALRGPILAVPYSARDGKGWVSGDSGVRYLLPELLVIDGELAVEATPADAPDAGLYVAALRLSGSFRPSTAAFPENSIVHWERASLRVPLSIPNAVRGDPSLRWGRAVMPMEPSPGDLSYLDGGLHAATPIATDDVERDISFSLELSVAGGDRLSILPVGAETKVHLHSSWPDVRFAGPYRPATAPVATGGFDATWNVLRSPAFVHAWNGGAVLSVELDQLLLGVNLWGRVDPTAETKWALDQETFVLALIFPTLLLFEVLGRVRLHLIHYLLIGLSFAVFDLLLASLIQHLSFTGAYLISAATVIGIVGAYSGAVLKNPGRSRAIAAMAAWSFGYLFASVRFGSYALLVASLGFLTILTVVMYLTRDVDWYAVDLPG